MDSTKSSPTGRHGTAIRRLLGERLDLDWKIVAATIVSTLLLLVGAYHQLTPGKTYDGLILYLAAPLVVILLAFRESPASYGFTLGDWKAGLLLTLVSIVFIAPVLWFAAQTGAMMQYYRLQADGLPWNTFLDLIGWEFLFRGFVLFTYSRKMGANALWLQAVPFALAHIGKPELETMSTIFGGFAFGWIAYRTRSFLYPFLIHWFVDTFTIVVAAGLLH